jgi:CheY-like chemotaxis protein
MPRKILVVDSSPVMRRIIRTAIQCNLSDVVVLETNDGQEAVAQIKKEKCDLILSSWELPVLDGVELFWKIRVNVLAHGVDHTPEKVRIAYKFIQVPADAKQAMQKVFNLAAEQEEQKAP